MIRQWSFFFQFFYVLGTIPIKASICVLVRIKRSLPWAKHATHGFSCLVGHIDSEQLGLCRHAIFLAVARADDEGRQGFSSPRSSTRRTSKYRDNSSPCKSCIVRAPPRGILEATGSRGNVVDFRVGRGIDGWIAPNAPITPEAAPWLQ
ncbi:hypothetical protein JOL62DRAFT_581317 [Phyllosticta paracitricarpa]|uniref:Secreted protein n=1 Tax=Phyllosticta paracitricarpa TaxID=2016321 RepID=A0ABR1MZF7_9PEZI